MSQFDFGNLYGQADTSGSFVYEAGLVDAVVETATWGRTKDGTKGQWDVRFRVSTGPNAGRVQLKAPITITTDSPQALGIMFRHLGALGIPVPDETNPQQQPFWVLGWDENQVAQAMIGKPALLRIAVDEWEGVPRNKVRDIRPARPGAPTTWPQFQQPQQTATAPGYGQPPQYGNTGFAQPTYPGGPAAYSPMAAQQQYQPQPQFQQPGYPAAPQGPQQPANAFNPNGSYAPPQQPAAPSAPAAPWQQPQGAPAANGAQAGPNPAVPPWAQPPIPGAGGVGEFTPQGQSVQPSQQGFQNPTAPFPQQPQPQFQQPGAQPAPAPGAAPWNGQQPPQQQPEAAGPQGAPPPPWAQ